MQGLTSRSPLALAVFAVLLDWPDASQPLRYLTGFPAVGHIELTGIFRDIPDTQEVEEHDFLGQASIDFVDSLLTRAPSPDATVIWSLTVEESAKGWCPGPFSRAQMDLTFQREGWRPVPRFLVTQPCGKQRLIDDAKKGSHNLATSMTETIYTIGIDLLPVLVDGMSRSVSLGLPGRNLPEWFVPTAGMMDLLDAYRGCPVEPHQRCYTVATTFSLQHRAWRFWIYTGLMYGLSSAVLSFNRLPTFLVAASRRLLALCAGAYFDDLFDLSLECHL